MDWRMKITLLCKGCFSHWGRVKCVINAKQLCACTFLCFHICPTHFMDFTTWLKCNKQRPQSLHSGVEYHSWPASLSQQTWPSCLVIRSEDLHSAYQSAPPADYRSKRAETKAANTESVGSGFSTGARMAACSIKRKTTFQSGIHSIGYTALIMQSTTSQHVNLLLPEPCSSFLTGDEGTTEVIAKAVSYFVCYGH